MSFLTGCFLARPALDVEGLASGKCSISSGWSFMCRWRVDVAGSTASYSSVAVLLYTYMGRVPALSIVDICLTVRCRTPKKIRALISPRHTEKMQSNGLLQYSIQLHIQCWQLKLLIAKGTILNKKCKLVLNKAIFEWDNYKLSSLCQSKDNFLYQNILNWQLFYSYWLGDESFHSCSHLHAAC